MYLCIIKNFHSLDKDYHYIPIVSADAYLVENNHFKSENYTDLNNQPFIHSISFSIVRKTQNGYVEHFHGLDWHIVLNYPEIVSEITGLELTENKYTNFTDLMNILVKYANIKNKTRYI